MPDENGLRPVPRIKRIRPELRVVVMSAQSTFMTALKAAERGAFEYLPKPFDLNDLLSAASRALAAPADAGAAGAGASDAATTACRWSAAARPMQEIYRTVARLTTTDLTVLITGESGTGKELVARALHDYGPPPRRPVRRHQLAAIPRELIESELFGHERGAFTGAPTAASAASSRPTAARCSSTRSATCRPRRRPACCACCRTASSPPSAAASRSRPNVRIIAATHRDLRALIRQGLFREDLFYRLNVVPIRLPPLRERPEDIPLLARALPERAKPRPAGEAARRRARWTG